MSSEWTALSIEKITFLIANAAHRKLSDEKLAQHFNNCFTTEKGQQLMTAGAVNCILASFKFADG